MIGYCATASSGIEIAPIKQMKSATTQAKIGLSIKKLGIDLEKNRRFGCAWLDVECDGSVRAEIKIDAGDEAGLERLIHFLDKTKEI